MISKIENLKKFFVCGGGGDETLPIGACYHYAEQQKIKPKPLESLYLGTNAEYTDNEIKIFDDYKVNKFENIEQVIDLVLENKILATCRGRAEMGPRSLGNRSILADPRETSNIQKINTAIKNRDFWMPFSPIVLSEYQSELIYNPKKLESPHMTIAFETVDGERKIPAAIHQADKTARPQLLKKEVNPQLWELIKGFYDKTGVPSLLNTSFNLHGEPIVNNIHDALHVFENSKLDVLWLDRHIIQK
jgi:carbamoyltransferase